MPIPAQMPREKCRDDDEMTMVLAAQRHLRFCRHARHAGRAEAEHASLHSV